MPEVKLLEAIDDFYRARRQANLREILARFTGKSVRLLSYEEVRQKLRAQPGSRQTLRDIPLKAIVGSVNRYDDFTRDFLPLARVEDRRWAHVKLAAAEMSGLPPIEVYQIGEAYFVKDGNHRVSVARQVGMKTIQAYVTEVHTAVPLTSNVTPDELILKTEYADFLQRTHLTEIRPDADLGVTAPGQYSILEEHIAVHRYFMGIDFQRDVSYEEAVAHWYDTVYLPAVTEICDGGLLREYPRRMEADLYLWVAEHQVALAEELGWPVVTEEVVRDLVERFSPGAIHHPRGLGERVLEAVFPDQMVSGPPPGQWREEKMTARNTNCLFSDILVPVNGTKAGWNALEQAINVAQRECGRLRGLYVVRTPDREKSSRARRVQERFDQRCSEAGITGQLVVTSGEVTRQILERARWNDLVTFNLAYPPTPGLRGRLASGVRKIVQRSPVPVLVTPGIVSPLSRALLVYDGSPKAREALFVATYLGGRWGIPLAVVTILREGQEAQLKAFDYLEAHSVQAVYVEDWGEISAVIMRVAEEQNSDLIVMGGYSRGPLLNVFIDDVVDQVLRQSCRPVLLCR